MSERTELSSHEKAMAYIANRTWGLDQSAIAAMYGVNQGRVSEAITAIEYAVNNTRLIYNAAVNAKKDGDDEAFLAARNLKAV